jgi:hypothetical protein
MSWLWSSNPPASHRHEVVAVLRPIMEGFGIEISAVWPLDRPKILVEFDRIEEGQVLERSEHLSLQDGSEIDPLLASVLEFKRQRVRAHDVEVRNAMDSVTHDVGPHLMQRFNLDRCPTGLQESPVLQQFRVMDFRPGLHKSLLCPGEFAADALDGIKGEHGPGLLVHRVKVWPMVRCADFHEHPNDDSEEPRQLWHAATLHRLPLVWSG